MQYREYGRTGIKVSALGFGAMRLPFHDVELSVSILHHAMAQGVNFIDTAYVYGEDGASEMVVGKALQGRRDNIILATKNPLFDETAEGWRTRLETSLTRLNTDYIDFYKVIHGINYSNYESVYLDTLLPEIMKAKEAGKIRHITFSSHDTPDNIIKLIDTGAFEGMLVQYNLLDRRNEPALTHAYENGMGVEIMGPVGGGRLGMASNRLRDLIPGISGTPELALRFVLGNPAVVTAFSGMNTMQQVDENCATASREEPLSAQEREQIEKALEENRSLSELYCTGCNYCLPCPQGVAIPEIFAAMNHHRVWGLTDLAKHMYAHFGVNNKDGKLNATGCVECGECESKCPQHIEIIRQLQETHTALG